MPTKRTDGPTGAREALVIAALILTLIAIGLLRLPTALTEGGAWTTLLPVVLLIGYSVAGWRIAWLQPGAARTAFAQSFAPGLWGGAAFTVHLTQELFIPLPGFGNAAAMLTLFLFLFLCFGVAGYRGARRTGQGRTGLMAAVWSAFLAVLIACLYGFLINFAFMPHMETILRDSPDRARSGIQDMKAFTVYNSLESCATLMIEAPILAAIFGGIGAFLGVRSAQKATPRVVGDGA